MGFFSKMLGNFANNVVEKLDKEEENRQFADSIGNLAYSTSGVMIEKATGERTAVEFQTDDEDRETAIKWLVNHPERSVLILIKMCFAEDVREGMPEGAIEVMGRIGLPAIEHLTGALLHSPDKWIRSRSANALANINDPRSVTALQNALNGPEQMVRDTAQYELQYLMSSGAFSLETQSVSSQASSLANIAKYIDDLSDQSLSVCNQAATKLGEMGIEAFEPLMIALSENDSIYQEAAARAYFNMGSNAVEPLAKCLHHESASVRFCAVKALGMFKDERAVLPLVELLNVKREANSAAELLAQMGNVAVEPLLHKMSDADAEVRCNAAAALGDMESVNSVKKLILALEDSDWNVRCKAAEALGKIGDLQAVDPLINAIRVDTSQYDDAPNADFRALIRPSDVRYWAACALGAIGDKRSATVLKELMDKAEEDDHIRRAAAVALTQMGVQF